MAHDRLQRETTPQTERHVELKDAEAVGRTHERMADASALVQVDEADGVLDELQAWYLTKVRREGWVYTSVLRQLVNRMYRDRDYLTRRSKQGRRTAYDYAVERDQKALSWAIQAIVRYGASRREATS